MTAATGPLAGLRVLELGQFAAGPYASSLLADLGADVIKVERPDGGDPMRGWPPIREGDGGEIFSDNFASINRNKRSLTLNLKVADERRTLLDLCKNADVLIENFRPGTLRDLELDFPNVSKFNPKLVYCSISGFGQTGPNAHKGAFDVTVQGASGLMSVTGHPNSPPVKCGVPVADFCTGLYAAYSIMAALRAVEHRGTGTYIDCSMMGSLIGIAALQTSEYFGTGVPGGKLGSAHPRNAPYQAFEASDGYFIIAAGTDELWRRVCTVVDMPDLPEDSRFATQISRAAHQDQLAAILTESFRQRPVDEWIRRMDEYGIPSAPVADYADVAADPHVAHMGLIKDMQLPNGVMTRTTAYPVFISGYDFGIYRRPPLLGEHTVEILAEWLGGGEENHAT